MNTMRFLSNVSEMSEEIFWKLTFRDAMIPTENASGYVLFVQTCKPVGEAMMDRCHYLQRTKNRFKESELIDLLAEIYRAAKKESLSPYFLFVYVLFFTHLWNRNPLSSRLNPEIYDLQSLKTAIAYAADSVKPFIKYIEREEDQKLWESDQIFFVKLYRISKRLEAFDLFDFNFDLHSSTSDHSKWNELQRDFDDIFERNRPKIIRAMELEYLEMVLDRPWLR